MALDRIGESQTYVGQALHRFGVATLAYDTPGLSGTVADLGVRRPSICSGRQTQLPCSQASGGQPSEVPSTAPFIGFFLAREWISQKGPR